MTRQDVERILLEAHIPMKLKGVRYLIDAVLLLDTPEWTQPKWTALYRRIARLNGATDAQVERAMRSALASIRGRFEDYETIEYFFGFANCENSSSIIHLYHAIQCKLNGELTGAESAPAPMDMELLCQMIRRTLVDILSDYAAQSGRGLRRSP